MNKNTFQQIALIACSTCSIFLWGTFFLRASNYFNEILSFADIDTSLNTYSAVMELYSFTLIRDFFITFAFTKVISIIKNFIVEFLNSTKDEEK